MNANGSPSLVIIDDDADLLARLVELLERELTDDGVEIRSWMPNDGDDPLKEFKQRVDANTVLVVTDYDLTKHGMTRRSLRGEHCELVPNRSIPVGDFSRGGTLRTFPREPALFELRIPPGIDEGAEYTARMFRGFRQVRDGLASDAVDLDSVRSPSEALAALLDRPQQESQFALYMSRLGAANSALYWSDCVLRSHRITTFRVREDAAGRVCSRARHRQCGLEVSGTHSLGRSAVCIFVNHN